MQHMLHTSDSPHFGQGYVKLADTREGAAMELLKFSPANSKTRRLAPVMGVKPSEIVGFSLPAGYTCPGASQCKAQADRETGSITDGPNCVFRCFAASLECQYPATRAMVWYNLELLKAVGVDDPHAMADLILQSLPSKAKIVRMHVSGDFFSPNYLQAWLIVARSRPGLLFYGYTKSIHFVIPFERQIPPNVRLSYSHGGRYDEIAKAANWPTAYVVMSPDDAAARGLPIDHKDSLAIASRHDFALLIHGTQPAGSLAGIASKANKAREKLA
jgi:hypothetical protein